MNLPICISKLYYLVVNGKDTFHKQYESQGYAYWQKNDNAIIETGLGSVFVQNKLQEKIQSLYYTPNYTHTHTHSCTHIYQ